MRRYNFCGETPLVLNFGGEGEIAGAINVNTLEFTLLPVNVIRRKGEIIEADMREVPLENGVADEIVGVRLPMRSEDDWAGRICREAYRLLKPGGTVRFNSRIVNGQPWLSWLHSTGFVEVNSTGQFAVGTKPKEVQDA